MELTRDKAKENLARLIEKFERELPANKIKDYNEEATKISFIQPLLKEVLGWEVGNQDEVSPEERISRGRVDYGLKVEGKIKVFVEAKPPRADLNKHIEQAVRYGYNRKGVPFVLLTDFEELKLFDVTVKPDSRNPLKGLKIDLRWNNYLKEFDKIWLFSKESVIKGELDKLLLVKPKDRLPVDKAILDDLKRWRESLAKDIFKNNPDLFRSDDTTLSLRGAKATKQSLIPDKEIATHPSGARNDKIEIKRSHGADYLKEITQRILDRIIFMRFCEDRNFVHRRPLKELFEERTETVGLNTMVFLKEEFKHYNLIFDSDLFRPQDWESDLAIDFKVMKDIVLDTYNPYQFDVIPLEVLGNIYEQYLGYTIRLTDHQVKYELKPDVRKAGGVYYTPEYIVDYIVKNTVGKLLQELPPSRPLSFRAERGISPKIKKLRILDPACGSGSFLIRAYEEMLNYYKSQKKQQSSLRHSNSSSCHSERSEESPQKKLDLKHEEAEPRLTIEEKSQILREHIFGVDIDEQAVEVTKLSLMLKMLEGEFGIIPGRSILPMLDKNIRCGNSLISGSPLGLKDLFGEDFYKTKPFNWKEEFRKIMVDEGGFDVVIGNPPYGAELSDSEKGFIKDKYITKTQDSAAYFLELAWRLSKNKFGMIVPKTITFYSAWQSIREFLLSSATLYSLLDVGIAFEDANYEQIVICFEKIPTLRKVIIQRAEPIKRYADPKLIKDDGNVPASFQRIANVIIFRGLSKEEQNIINKIRSISIYLGEICEDSFRGLYIPDREKETLKKGKWKFINKVPDVQRYKIIKTIMVDISHNTKYLNLAKKILQPRLFFKVLRGERLVAYPDINGEYLTTEKLVNFIVRKSSNYHYYALAGIINSKVPSFYIQRILFSRVTETSRVMDLIYSRYIPIPKIDFSQVKQKKLHDDLVALVDVMLDLNKKIQTAKGSEKDQIQRQIDKTDREIDDIVYKLYGIAEEEKKIIEG
jgi:type I restriction-modification system DNA methylase subunit